MEEDNMNSVLQAFARTARLPVPRATQNALTRMANLAARRIAPTGRLLWIT